MKETMSGIAIAIILFLRLIDQFYAETLAEYETRRTNLIEADSQRSLGYKMVLTEKEQLVNEILIHSKHITIDTTFNNPSYLNFSEPYFAYREIMRQSKAYQMIRQMPKGAALHVHSIFMLDPLHLLQLTHEEHLYVCITWDDLQFVFSKTFPKLRCTIQWTLVSDARSDQYYNNTPFDELLLDHFIVGLQNYAEPNFDKDEVWKKLIRTISTISSLTCYRPVREKMIYQALQSFYDDNIMYVEIRTSLDKLYELNGTVHEKFYSAVIYDQVAKNFSLTHPDFLGIKLIITAQRSASIQDVKKELELALKVKEMMPGLIAGFDLIGQGRPLRDFVPILLEAKEMVYSLHAGETNQYGTPMDENLFDAILLGAKRIGHGESLIKHPTLVNAVARNNIAIEANVISNSMLAVDHDLRSNPLAAYLALGLPVVLSSSDPGVWGTKPLSDDFFLAFVAVASRHADLRMLKQLAINSIRYSALDRIGQEMLFKIFDNRWVEFINDYTKIENKLNEV